MRWRDSCAPVGRFARVAVAVAAAALVAGCFQPLYGDRSPSGGPGVRQALAAVDVQQIDVPANSAEAGIAVAIRNSLIFSFTGGSEAPPPSYRLKVMIAGTRLVESIDRSTALPSIEGYTLRASYTLTEIATGKPVVTGQASTNVSYDTLGQQRFARYSGLKDAERRAAKVISDNIAMRLASYFVAGT
jgi:LPS-assembly lipoprotein